MSPAFRILVLGASGQLGAELCRQLGPAALPAARNPPDAEWLRMDLEQLATEQLAPDMSKLPVLLERNRVSAVLCAAGATDVERCETDPAWAASANHTGPLALARAARDMPFVFFSTDYVFDGLAGPYGEADTPRPLSIYGRTKLQGEQAILDAHPTALVLRTTTVYGPDPQRKNFLYTLQRLLAAGQTMRVPSDQYANPTYNADLASAALALLRAGQSGLFHVAGPEFLPRTAFAAKACRLLGLDESLLQPLRTTELAQRAARPLLGGLRSERLAEVLGPGTMRSPDRGIGDWAATLSGPAGSQVIPQIAGAAR